MRRGLWHKRMPTLFAFLLLFVSIWVTSYLIQTGVIFVGKAAPDKAPQNIKIANITDSSFTVTFTTNAETSSALSVEEVGKNPNLVFDDRNKKTGLPAQAGEQNEFYSHYITVSDLAPQTSYNFTIIADGERYQNDDQKYFVKTGPAIREVPSSQKPIAGRGLLPDGQEASDTIVELNVPGAQKITAITSGTGEFTIPTSFIRKDDLNGYLKLESDTPVTIVLRRQDLSSTIQTLFKNAESLESLTLAQSYDFTDIEEDQVATKASELRVPTPKAAPGVVRISTPRENESFVDARPLFKGTALPNQKVKIKIESEILIDEVIADRNGLWSYRPPKPIGPGQHKITIETIDSFGVVKILTQNFTVFAQGSQVTESATPSATPSPTSTPTPPQTPVPTTVPTLTPTSAPTATPTILPSITISPTQVPIVTPAPPGSSSSLILTVISVLLIFAGSALLFVL